MRSHFARRRAVLAGLAAANACSFDDRFFAERDSADSLIRRTRFIDDQNMCRTIACPFRKERNPRARPSIVSERNAGSRVMTSSFLIAISVWFGINILFVTARLWVTRPERWQRRDAAASRLGVIHVKSRLHRQV